MPFILDGIVQLYTASSFKDSDHSGVRFFVYGEIDIAADHSRNSCNLPPGGLVPGLRAIRLVEPAS
ncbi:MAG: hypothetical protein WBV78_07690 [Roseobacter sp.]